MTLPIRKRPPWMRARFRNADPGHQRQARLWALRAFRALSESVDIRLLVLHCDEARDLAGLPCPCGTGTPRQSAAGRLRRRLASAEAEAAVDATLRDRPLFRNVARFERVFGFSPTDCEVLAFAASVQTLPGLGELFAYFADASTDRLARFLARVLAVDHADVARALDRNAPLLATGLVQSIGPDDPIHAPPLPTMDGLERLLAEDYPDDEAFVSRFFRRAPVPDLGADDFPHLRDDLRLLVGFLERARRENAAGVNVLLYGPPGTGKTQLTRIVAKELGMPLYEVNVADGGGDALEDKQRRTAYQLCQRLLQRSAATLVVFDEAEDVFPVHELPLYGLRMRSGEAKGFTNRMLEGNPVPTLWVSNSVRQIDPAFLRRFDYHLEVRVPPRPVRRRILEKHVDGLAVGPAWLERMAGCENLSPADVRGAARVVGLSGLTDRDAVEAALDRVLGNRVAVRGEALAVNQQHEDGLGYRLDYVNATHDLGELAASFERHPRGSILLYGPPGTGKTRWARHLADRLGRPLLVRRASDLLDCWVGNTEKNIARMFREARAEGAVLLLDEADSFLRERGGAVRSWEVTQVNELLTQMESFDGLFVCSTNLVDWLDAASFRRFTFKVRLSYAGPEQAWAMFVALAEDLGVDLGPGRGRLREAVDRLRCLTPGDFATVRRQARLLAGPHDARKLLAALEEECRAKKESGCGRPLGFCG